MCGIVGYVGKRDALPILIHGIKTLEYRGYDSAGIAVFDGKKVRSEKAVGKVANLETKILKAGDINGTLGICHSRWATHGGVTEVNAHPHSDCGNNIWIAHNGIIENYRELKDDLIKSGHRFKSETDTEVLAHLFEAERKVGANITLGDVVKRALRKVKGTYGLVVIDAREPKTLVAARNFSPMVLGLGEGEYLVASDAAAVVGYTKKVIYLRNGEIAVLTPEQHSISNFEEDMIERVPEEITWTVDEAKRGGYPHLMLKEIFEQPEAILNSIRGRLMPGEGLARLGGLEPVRRKLDKKERLLIAACGTAYHAGCVGEYFLEEYAGIPTEVNLASEFRYRKLIFDPKKDFFLAISQSGETADTLAAVSEAKRYGILALGIVNAVGSSIARETDAGVYQHIGPEISVASTKAFTSQVAILALLALYLGRERQMSLAMGKRIAEELQKIPEYMRTILKSSGAIKEIAKKYLKFNNFFYLGRKYNLPVALEGALKLKEISYVHAEGGSTAEMKHGPIAMIDKNFPSVVIVPNDSVYEKNLSNIQEIKARGGPIIAVATSGDKEISKIADHVFYIPKTLEMLTPLLSVLPLQLFAYHFAALKGRDIDRPRNLAKSVTVE